MENYFLIQNQVPPPLGTSRNQLMVLVTAKHGGPGRPTQVPYKHDSIAALRSKNKPETILTMYYCKLNTCRTLKNRVQVMEKWSSESSTEEVRSEMQRNKEQQQMLEGGGIPAPLSPGWRRGTGWITGWEVRVSR